MADFPQPRPRRLHDRRRYWRRHLVGRYVRDRDETAPRKDLHMFAPRRACLRVTDRAGKNRRAQPARDRPLDSIESSLALGHAANLNGVVPGGAFEEKRRELGRAGVAAGFADRRDAGPPRNFSPTPPASRMTWSCRADLVYAGGVHTGSSNFGHRRRRRAPQPIHVSRPRPGHTPEARRPRRVVRMTFAPRVSICRPKPAGAAAPLISRIGSPSLKSAHVAQHREPWQYHFKPGGSSTRPTFRPQRRHGCPLPGPARLARRGFPRQRDSPKSLPPAHRHERDLSPGRRREPGRGKDRLGQHASGGKTAAS